MRRLKHFAGRFAGQVSTLSGNPITLFLGVFMIFLWAVLGPFMNFSDTWQLTVNTATTIVTFITSLSIQYTQNRDTKAVQRKLNKIEQELEDDEEEQTPSQ